MKESNLLETYSKYPIKIVKGKGAKVYDEKGNEYLDFYGGHAVSILGHCPDFLIKTIEDQSKKLIFYSNIVKTEPQEKLADLLVQPLDKKYKVFFTNSGAEANETAIKIIRKNKAKKHIISFKNSFHGRSAFASAVTGIDSYRNFDPNFDEFTSFADFGDINSIEKIYKQDQTAGIILEPIQSIGGANTAQKSFFKDLTSFCKEKGILLISDEIQTGLGRTGGEFYYSSKVDLEPDIITLAKGIASGLPISAVIISEEIAKDIKLGEYATTFGGGPLVCAAGVTTISKILSEGFLDEVQKNAEYLRKKLLNLETIKKLRGDGFLIGIELEKEDKNFISNCLKNGLIIGGSYNKKVFRLLPPINLTREEIDKGVEILSNLI